MTPDDQNTICRWASHGPPERPGVSLAVGTDKTAAVAFTRFCDAFKEHAAGIRLQRDGDHPSKLPALMVGPHGNIAFQILPEGKWLGIFLDAIGNSQDGEDAVPEALAARLDQLQLPVSLNLYVAQHCPHCPQTVRQLIPLARTSPLLRLAIIDAALFPENATNDRIQAVPTLIMEDQFRWTGAVDPREILDFAVRQDPTQLSPGALRQFLADGHAPKAAEMMVTHGCIFPALIDLLTDESWSVRLAAMVTVESVAEDAPDLAQQIIDPLWERFPQCSTPVKGDLAYVLGVIDCDAARRKLQIIANRETDPQVKDAALEALSENEAAGTEA